MSVTKPEYKKELFTCPYCQVHTEQNWFHFKDKLEKEIMRSAITTMMGLPLFPMLKERVKNNRLSELSISTCKRCTGYIIWEKGNRIHPKEDSMHEQTGCCSNCDTPLIRNANYCYECGIKLLQTKNYPKRELHFKRIKSGQIVYIITSTGQVESVVVTRHAFDDSYYCRSREHTIHQSTEQINFTGVEKIYTKGKNLFLKRSEAEKRSEFFLLKMEGKRKKEREFSSRTSDGMDKAKQPAKICEACGLPIGGLVIVDVVIRLN